MDQSTLRDLLGQQGGVVTRRQVLAAGGADSDIARWIRRRLLVRVHDGVYAGHTGPLSILERSWAAVLRYWPAALCHESALDMVLGARPTPKVVHVAVDSERRVDPARGVVVHRLKDFDAVALMNLSPPRVRIEQAALEVAAAARSDRQAVSVLADAVQSRRTTAARLLDRLEELPRLRRRQLLRDILTDVGTGAYSVLERMYLRDVERLHRLPKAHRQRQVRSGGLASYRDVEYREQCMVVELDGRLGHEWSADKWADLDRDVAAAVDHRLTVRLGYGQVLEPCRVAAALATILQARGWAGSAVACAPDCSVGGVRGGSSSTGEGDPPLIA